MAMSDPIADIIGDYRAFAAMQRDRLVARGIDIAPYPLSHLAVRVADWDLYVHQRTLLERHARANRENVWNGRPISLIVLAEPLEVLDGTPVSLIELIPPVHQRVYRMGLEHLGVVVGEDVRRLLASASGRADWPAVPESRRRAGLRPVRGLHPREVLPPLLLRRRRASREGASTASATSTTGCRSGWSPPPARTRCRGDRGVRRRWRRNRPAASRSPSWTNTLWCPSVHGCS